MIKSGQFKVELESTDCNICKIDEAETLFDLTDPTTACVNKFPVVRCNSCGLVYLRERPTIKDIDKFYPEDFVSYQFAPIEGIESPDIKDKIISSITRSMNVERIKSIAHEIPLVETTKVLDVGCGKGAFLFYLKKSRQCRVFGLDFDKTCLSFCHSKLGIEVFEGNIASNHYKLESPFDLITMWAFLEHDFDPLASLLQAHDCLKQEGLLVIEVPNEQSLEYNLFGKSSFLYDPPRHLYNFSLSTIDLLLKKAGFRIEKVTYPVGAGGWFGSIQRLLTKDRVYKSLKGHVMFLLIVGVMIYPLELFLGLIRQGSVIRVFARKVD
jgi:SAM-dependent methyltransferase